MSDELHCWRCGASLAGLPLPLARLAACPACAADLHVCRMCRFYDRGVANGCREPVAEPVHDKDRANFCQWLQPRPGAWTAGGVERAAGESRARLEGLFGLPATAAGEAGAASEADRARQALERLFGTDDRGSGPK
jgi:hypothetical protein